MLAHKRLQRELIALTKEPPQYIRARPLESDILTFYYVIEGPPDSPFAGGHYFGALKFPPEYPLKPPAVLMYTPNGRFQQNTRLCLSMSDFHPETWNPVWSVSTILMGLLSFMLEASTTVGSVESTVPDKQRHASQSLEWNVTNTKDFVRLFPELASVYEQRKSAAAAAAAAATAAAVERSRARDAGVNPAGSGAAAGSAAAEPLIQAGGTDAPAPAPAAPGGVARNGGNGLLILLALVAAMVIAYFQRGGGGGQRHHS